MCSDPQTDEGSTLVETLVALAIFAVLAAVAAGLLLSALSLTKGSAQRTAAANLAAQYVEEVRAMRTRDIPDGGTSYPAVSLGGTTYQVKRTSSYVSAGEGVSLCAGSGSKVAYKLVSIVVTWPGMGSTQPVRTDTLKALGLGAEGLTATRGVVAVQVLSSAGKPVPDAGVALSTGASSTTGADGCAVFPELLPGSGYTATVQALPGWSGPRGAATPSLSLAVSPGVVSRGTLSFDRSAVLRTAFLGDPAYVVPPTVGISMNDSTGTEALPECSVNPAVHCVSGTPRVTQRVFPSTYAVWGGTCAPKPVAPVSAVLPPGGTVDVAVRLAPLRVDLTTGGAPAAPATRTLYLTAVSTTSCAAQHSITTSGSTAYVALPTGSWRLSTTASGVPPTGGTAPTVALDATSTTPVVQAVAVP